MSGRGTRIQVVAAAAAFAALVFAAVALAASRHHNAVVKTARNGKLGKTVLVDSGGRTLYHLTAESASHIVCTGACVSLWPPLLVHTRAAAVGKGPHGKRLKGLGAVRRPDGLGLQVTYHGLPLYRFSGDHAPGDANGEGFLNVWFALPVAAHGPAKTARPAPTAPVYPTSVY